MRKASVLALLISLSCMIPIIAFAAKCPYHPNASVVKDSPSWWERHSDVKHKGQAGIYCSVCGQYLETTYVFEWHHYDSSDICVDCGYSKPSQDKLNTQAIKASPDIIGRELWILHDGSIYSEPNGYYLFSVSTNEQYYILDYKNFGSTLWLQVSSTSNRSPLGWMQSSIASISTRKETSGYEDVYIGRPFRITVSSGRGRSSAGQEYPYIETVHYGDVYTILDVAYASNGVAWYKLHVSGSDCWVSSGLGEIK